MAQVDEGHLLWHNQKIKAAKRTSKFAETVSEPGIVRAGQ